MIYLYIITLLLIGCDDPLTYNCPNGQIMDDCGNCRDCETDECGWNDIMDDCGECGGDNTSCIECTDPAASNFGSNQECQYNSPELWIIDLQFLTEDHYCISNNPLYTNQCSQYNNENSCNLFAENYECSWIGSFEFYTNIPIYWNNTSNQDITIYTEDSENNYCDITIESGVNANCNQYVNEITCENALCDWILSPTYNPFWDEYSETIPQGTTGIQHSYFFLGCDSNSFNCGAFNAPTEEVFCAQINGIEKCGSIKVLN